MALENTVEGKRTSRRGFLKTGAVALAGTLCVGYGCPNSTEETEYAVVEKPTETRYDQFVDLLGPEKQIKHEKELRELFESEDPLDVSDSQAFLEIYSNPEEFIKKCPKSVKKAYANFAISEKKANELQKKYFWTLDPNNKSDKIMLFLLDSNDKNIWYGNLKIF